LQRKTRKTVEQEVNRIFLKELSKSTPDTRWLPMPVKVKVKGQDPKAKATKLGLDEWLLYRKHQAAHQVAEPNYHRGWERPTPETAQSVWNFLSDPMGLRLASLAPPTPAFWELENEEKHELDITTMQAFTVVLADTLRLGELKQTLTFNRFFAMLCSRWSDTWRAKRESEEARSVYEMTPSTVRACWRDLLRNRISAPRLWDLLRKHSIKSGGNNPLFWLERLEGDGFKVRVLAGSPDITFFRKILESDPDYLEKPGRFPILTDKEATSELAKKRPIRHRVLAEHPYNIVTFGPRSERVLRLQESAQLLLDVQAFRDDYFKSQNDIPKLEKEIQKELALTDKELSALLHTHTRHLPSKVRQGKTYRHNSRKRGLRRLTDEDRSRAARLLKFYDRAVWIQTRFAEAYKTTEPIGAVASASKSVNKTLGWLLSEPHWIVQSAFYKTINRRFQAVHLHPAAVTTKSVDEPVEASGDLGSLIEEMRKEEDEDYFAGLRFRWFKSPAPDGNGKQELVGYDVSASQLQITAVLTGLESLEQSIRDGRFRKELAETALPRMKPGYTGADDPRLMSVIKNLTMVEIYGGAVHNILSGHRKNEDTYGPGWTAPEPEAKLVKARAQKILKSKPDLDEKTAQDHAAEILQEEYAAAQAKAVLDTMDNREGVLKFLKACRRMASVAYKENYCAGVKLTDPLDKHPYVWNPIRPWDTKKHGQPPRISFGGIGPYVGRPDPRNKRRKGDGAFEVWKAKLENMAAPCLVHSLDAYFASIVIERLHKLGVTAFASIHDCWYVPETIRVAGVERAGIDVLAEVLQDAAREWFEGLGPVFEDLIRYLGKDTARIPRPAGSKAPWTKETYGEYVHRIKAEWETRLEEAQRGNSAKWPQFKVSLSRK